MSFRIKLLLSCTLLAIAGIAQADGPPVVGFWDRLAATAPGDVDGAVVAKPDFIFTNIRLAAPTRFTGLQDNGGSSLTALCCLEVSDLQPLTVEGIIAKYHYDGDVAEHLRSIKGLPFVYTAHPTERATWSPFMRTVMGGAGQADDPSPYWAPVIGTPVADSDIRGHSVAAGKNVVQLHIAYGDAGGVSRETDTFLINGKALKVSSTVIPTE